MGGSGSKPDTAPQVPGVSSPLRGRAPSPLKPGPSRDPQTQQFIRRTPRNALVLMAMAFYSEKIQKKISKGHRGRGQGRGESWE